jgi:rubrerythrin
MNRQSAVFSRMSKKSKKTPAIKLPPPSVAGWRCDLCGEIVTTKERPLTPPERCPRCHSDHLTSMEVWAARRPNLGLWTR